MRGINAGNPGAPPAPSGQDTLTRVVVTESGECKGQFDDNTICLLDPTGAAMTIITPDGQVFRQRTEFAQTRFARHAATVLAFRNMHLEEPHFSGILCGFTGTSLFQTKRFVQYARWPKSASVALDTGAAEILPDGSVSLKADEDTARLVLPPTEARFTIVYPLLVEKRDATQAYEYFWQLQTFSCAGCPARWEPALECAREVRRAVQDGDCSSEPTQQGVAAADGGAASHGVSEAGAGAMVVAGGGERGAADDGYRVRRSELPRSTSHEEATWQDCPEGSWYRVTSDLLYPPGVTLVIEWTPAALCQYLPGEGEVEVVVAADSSSLKSFQGGRFFKHVRCEPGAASATYAADVVPQHARSADGSVRYAVGPLVTRAASLRAHASRVSARIAPPTSSKSSPGAAGSGAGGKGAGGGGGGREAGEGVDGDPLPPWRATKASSTPAAFSMKVHKEESIPGTGTFTAYEDGRVRIVFSDRTILEMDGSHQMCKLILRDGAVSEVRCSNPIGVEEYVKVAAEYAMWAFATPEEHARRDDEGIMVEQEILSARGGAQVAAFAARDSTPGARVVPEGWEPPEGGGGEGGAAGGVDGEREERVGDILERNRRMLEALMAA